MICFEATRIRTVRLLSEGDKSQISVVDVIARSGSKLFLIKREGDSYVIFEGAIVKPEAEKKPEKVEAPPISKPKPTLKPAAKPKLTPKDKPLPKLEFPKKVKKEVKKSGRK